MSDYGMGVLLILISVLVSSVSQIMLKIAAGKTYPSKIREYLNPLVIIAYVMFLGATVLTMLALRTLPLSQQPLFESAGYVFVAVMGFFILKEKFTKKKIIGLVLILAGILIFTL